MASAPEPSEGYWSSAISSSEMRAEISAAGSIPVGFALVLFAAPGVLLVLLAVLDGEMPVSTALAVGAGLFALLSALVFGGQYLRRRARSWDGVVVDKRDKEKTTLVPVGDEDASILLPERVHVWTTVFRADDGRRHTLKEHDDLHPFYDYLVVGDRVRYHPQLSFYERYDKTRDGLLLCPFCKEDSPRGARRCANCGKPLLY